MFGNRKPKTFYRPTDPPGTVAAWEVWGTHRVTRAADGSCTCTCDLWTDRRKRCNHIGLAMVGRADAVPVRGADTRRAGRREPFVLTVVRVDERVGVYADGGFVDEGDIGLEDVGGLARAFGPIADLRVVGLDGDSPVLLDDDARFPQRLPDWIGG
jgi:hypothetical protein